MKCGNCKHLVWFGDYNLYYCDITRHAVEKNDECSCDMGKDERRKGMTPKELYEKILTARYKHLDETASFACERYGETLYIYFEESNGLTDWKNNFDFPAKPYREMENKWYAHRGFLKVWKIIEPHLKPSICDPTVKQIIIGGYSHGAAIAALCHEYCRYNRPDISVVGFGFGAPRVLWGFMRKAVKKRFEGFTVVRNGRDIVTFAPPIWLGYRHVGDLIEIGQGKEYNPIESHFPDNYKKELRDLYGE